MTLFFYLFKDIIKNVLAVSLVLLLIVSSGRLAKYLGQASAGELAPELVFSIILFRLPDFLPLILPLGTFVGVMLVFGRLYIESEMAALFASGVSKLKILCYACIPAFLVSVVVAALTLWASPNSLVKVESLLAESKQSHRLLMFREGKFINDRDGYFTAYIGRIGEDRSLQRIFFMEQDGGLRPNSSNAEVASPGRSSVMVANQGRLLDGSGSDEQIIELSQGRIYEGEDQSLAYRVSSFDAYTQRIQIERDTEQRKLKIDALPTMSLLESADPRYVAAFHWRFSLPATVMVVAILALAMSRTDPRKGRYGKMLPAILIYLIYIVSLSAVRNFIEENKLPGLALWCLHGFYLCAALLAYYLPDFYRRLSKVPEQINPQGL